MSLLHTLQTPIIGLSPMDDITDNVFRYIVNKYGDPDVTYTEFESVDSLIHSKEPFIKKLLYDEIERPIIAQFFGIDPKLFYYAGIITRELGFDGMDINMGCPSKNVSQRGAGAGLIKDPTLAVKIIKSSYQGLRANVNELPKILLDKLDLTLKKINKKNNKTIPLLSIKTRIGYSGNEISEWIPHLALKEISCICIHGRSLKQMYTGRSDYTAIKEARDIIKSINKDILVLGNGDVLNREHGEKLCKEYDLDGVLIGRNCLGNPMVFKNIELDINTMFKILLEHSKLFSEYNSSLNALRKHLAWYIKGFEGASLLRSKLVRVNTYEEVEEIINEYLDKMVYSK